MRLLVTERATRYGLILFIFVLLVFVFFLCLFIFTCFFYLLLFVYLSSGVFLIFFFESHENELLSLKENYTFQGFRESVFLTLEMLCYSNTHFPRYTQGIPVIPNPPSMAT